MDISKRIKSIREVQGLKQYEVADRIGVEPPQYNRWEKRGDKLTIEQLNQIATALGVTIKDILFEESEHPNTELSKLELALSMERNAALRHKNQQIYLLDNVLKFILNIGKQSPQQKWQMVVGESFDPSKNEYKTFVKCVIEVGTEVFTLATWQKNITSEEIHFDHSEAGGEILFEDAKDKKGQKKASQLKDRAFSDVQENPEFWKINFINLTAFFEEVLGGE